MSAAGLTKEIIRVRWYGFKPSNQRRDATARPIRPKTKRCFLEIPEMSIIPSQTAPSIIAFPISGSTRISRMRAREYNPETIICRKSPISTCRRERYLARRTSNASLAKSAGWNEISPNENHARAPRTGSANKRSDTSIVSASAYIVITTGVRRMKLTSIFDMPKYAHSAIASQSICRGANDVPSPNVLIVRIPSRESASAGTSSVQSKNNLLFVSIVLTMSRQRNYWYDLYRSRNIRESIVPGECGNRLTLCRYDRDYC